MEQVSGLLRLADGQGELEPQLVKVCGEAADCLACRLAGFNVLLLDLNVPHDGKPKLFKEKVLKVIPCDVIYVLNVLASVPRILNILDEIPSCIYDFLTFVAVDVWQGAKYLVAGADKLKVFLVRLTLVLQGF